MRSVGVAETDGERLFEVVAGVGAEGDVGLGVEDAGDLADAAGDHVGDLIAMVRVRNHDDVASVVADRLNKVSGVTETETHIAFRAYSQHDLESAFSLGLD